MKKTVHFSWQQVPAFLAAGSVLAAIVFLTAGGVSPSYGEQRSVREEGTVVSQSKRAGDFWSSMMGILAPAQTANDTSNETANVTDEQPRVALVNLTANVTPMIVQTNLHEAHYRIGKDTPLAAMEWYGVVDNKTAGIRRNTSFRVRFQVYNSSSNATNWQPQLEFMGTGGGWVVVPTVPGSSPFFVASTDRFNDGEVIATGNFGLGAGIGTPQVGYAHDTSNPPSAITLNTLSYTEIEFNVMDSPVAIPSTPYAFRLTNNGIPFDSYANNALVSVWENDSLNSPHLEYTTTTEKCAFCHRTHSAPGKGLKSTVPEESLCNSCHNGTRSRTNITAQFTAKPYAHPISATTGVHVFGEGAYNWSPAGSRHVECEDCHNSHASRTGLSTPGIGDLSGSLVGISGVRLTNPSTVWAQFTEANYSSFVPVVREYQLCLKCHSSYAYGAATPPPTHTGGITQTDQAKEFNVNNMSYHWVETDQTAVTGVTPRTNTVGRNMSFTPGSGMDKDTALTCSNCHGSDTAGEPGGLHGSNQPYILKGTWSDTPSGTQFDLCLRCHDPAVYGRPSAPYDSDADAPGMTSFAGAKPNLHRYHMDKASTTAGCQNCHSAVPHGGWNRALLVQITDLAPYNKGSKLMVNSWAQPGAWMESSCTGCH